MESESLSTRIAHLVAGKPTKSVGDAFELADAVIEALPVIKALPQQVEWRADFGYDGYAKCETRDEARARVDEFNAALGDDIRDGEQAMVMYRYVTEWSADV